MTATVRLQSGIEDNVRICYHCLTVNVITLHDPVFGRDTLKTGVTYFVGREETLKRRGNRVTMTDDMMASAENRFDMIQEVMQEISQEMKQSA